jgi:HSP20 family protein
VPASTLARASRIERLSHEQQNEIEEAIMAGTMIQNRTAERERELARRDEDYLRDGPNWGPFAMMRRLSEEMDRAFTSSLGLSRDRGGRGSWSPAVEVRERDGSLEVIAELPGLKKEDVKLECTDEGMIIEGERRQEREENQRGFQRSERSYGYFYRMIPLPAGADPDKAKAEFKDGLLQVNIPIVENKRQRRSIPIAV